MDFDPEDQEIIRLLTKIKDAEGGYPEHMLVARRHSYLKRMVEVNLGIPADLGVKNTTADVKPSNISPMTSTLVETALVVAIIAEASTVAYFYRDQLADFFRKTVLEPKVQEIGAPSVVPSSLEIQGMTPSPAWAVTVASETSWPLSTPTETVVTITNTPRPGVVDNSIATAMSGPSLLNSASTGEPNVANSTPVPSNNNSSGNNGNHYGQTPMPERTKESGNNPAPKDENEQPPKENEDKPPKENEDIPPKDNNKPPNDNNNRPPKK